MTVLRKNGAVYLNGKELKKGITGKVTVLSDGINFELFADDGSVFALLAEINENHGKLSFVSGSGSDLTIYKK